MRDTMREESPPRKPTHEQAHEEVRAWLEYLKIQIPDPDPVVLRWGTDGNAEIPIELATDDDLIIHPDTPSLDELAAAVVGIVTDCYKTFPGRRNWRRWKLTGRLRSFLYCSGITANGGSYSMDGRDPIGGWIHRLPSWTMHRRCYVLWKPMWWWECHKRQGLTLRRHKPAAPFAFGVCARCAPCPSCGEPYDCRPDCEMVA